MDESQADESQAELSVEGAGIEDRLTDLPAARLHVRWFLIPLGIVTLLVCGGWWLIRILAGPPDPVALIRDLSHPGRESWQQAYAFVELLRDPQATGLRTDRTVCRAVAETLAASLDRENSEPQVVKTQVFLCRALGEFQVSDGLSVLLCAAEPRPERAMAVRCAAIESIAVLASHAAWADSPDSHRVVPTLVAAANETVEATGEISPARWAATAAFACGVVGGEEACGQLRQLLHDTRPEVRYNAATGLARHGDVQCVPVLIEMLTTAGHSPLATPAVAGARERVRDVLVRNAVRASLQLHATHPRAQVSTLRDALRAQLDGTDLPAGLRLEVQAALAELDRAAASEAHGGGL